METYENTRKSTNLRIGYFYDIKTLSATECMKRAVNLAKNQLEEEGHTLVKIDLPKTEELTKNFL